MNRYAAEPIRAMVEGMARRLVARARLGAIPSSSPLLDGLTSVLLAMEGVIDVASWPEAPVVRLVPEALAAREVAADSGAPPLSVDHATDLVAVGIAMIPDLRESVLTVPAVRDLVPYRDAVKHVVERLDEGVLEPLYRQHPFLRPPAGAPVARVERWY